MRVLLNYGRRFELVPDAERAGGGIISATVGLAAALAARGHEVHVFGRVASPGEHLGAHWHDRADLAGFAAREEVDVLIAVPELLVLLAPVRARARIVWSGNAYDTGDCLVERDRARVFAIGAFPDRYDRYVVKSRYQRDRLNAGAGLPPDRYAVIFNGLRLEPFEGPAPARDGVRVVYTSLPRRGLDVLLAAWPRVRAAVPHATLDVFADVDGPLGDGVRARGRVGKRDLARELRAAGVFAYPCTSRSETFCTAVAEAQAAGLAVVTTRLGALAERTDDGVDGLLADGDPEAFAGALIAVLTDPSRRAALGAAAAAKARREYAWEAIAAQWERECAALASGREAVAPPATPASTLFAAPMLRDLRTGAPLERALAEQWLAEALAGYGYAPADVVDASS